VALDPAVDEQGWGRKIPSESGSKRVDVFKVLHKAGFRTVGARAKASTGSRGAGATVTTTCSRDGATVVIGHTELKSWEVNASTGSGEGKSTARSASSPRGSSQIRGTVSVHQGSLIRKACLYFVSARTIKGRSSCPEGVYVGGLLR
jgi:hypothetical protein